MKRLLNCIFCNIEYEKSGVKEIRDEQIGYFYKQIDDDGAYNVECPNGHKNFIVDQNLKFQLLFESGLYAYINGFYRESVASVWASLERFYEFASRVILSSFDVFPGHVNGAFSEMADSSERQIGGFYYLYTARFNKELPYLKKDKDFGFRNKVIHKGHFPNEVKTKEFIARVYSHIVTILQDLNEAHHKHIVLVDGLQNAGKTAKRNNEETKGMLTIMKMPVCINIAAINNETGKLVVNDLDKYIQGLEAAIYI